MRYLDGITDSMGMNLGKLREMVRDKGSLVCCSPWGWEELDMTEQLNNNKNSYQLSKWSCPFATLSTNGFFNVYPSNRLMVVNPGPNLHFSDYE